MKSAFNFVFNYRKVYDLIALDIIDGLDDNYYVVDINGLVSLWPLVQHQELFESNIKKLFDEDFYFDSLDVIKDHDKYKIGSGNPDSNVHIYNYGFSYEDKIKWRNEFKIKCPNINENINIHTYENYPKYLVKPNNGYKSKGIKLYNDCEFKDKIIDDYFVEEFIPSKLIDEYVYSIRVYMIINEEECHPILYLQRNCSIPIIKKLDNALLNNHERNSYLTNSTDSNKFFYINDSQKLKDFVSELKIYN